MAMRPRGPTFKTQPSARRLNEPFRPKSEMQENPDAYLLEVYLPGFTKEQIKITYVGASRTVKISGERPIEGSNRWSRFDQTYPVPESCEVDKIQGKFETGSLKVTMPKKFITGSQVDPKAELKTTTQEKGPSPSEKAIAEPKPEKKAQQEEPIEDKKSTSSLPSMVKGPAELKAQKESIESPKPIDEKGLKALTPPEPIKKGQEGIDQKPEITPVTPKMEFGTKQGKESIVGTKGEEDVSKKEAKEVELGKPYESRKPETDAKKGIFEEKEIRTRKRSARKAYSNKQKEEGKSKEDMIETIGKGIREVVASTSQVVTRITEGKLNDEDKQLIVNMGAAVLVIAALGAYMSYRFASSEKSYN